MARKEYNIDCYFDVKDNECFYDIMKYEMVRHCTDIESMIFYVFDWVEKYGEKFGEINCVEIYDEYHDELLAVIHFDIDAEEVIIL